MTLQQRIAIPEALERIRSEFTEMPDMRLTGAGLQRLCGVDPVVCESAIGVLLDCGFLVRHQDGSYLRPPQESVVRGRDQQVRVSPDGGADSPMSPSAAYKEPSHGV